MKRLSFLIAVCGILVFSVSTVFGGIYLNIDVDETLNETTVEFVQTADPAGIGGTFEIIYTGVDAPDYVDGTPISGADPGTGQINWNWLVNDVSTLNEYVRVDKLSSLFDGTPGSGTVGYNYTFALVFPTEDNFTMEYSGVWNGMDISDSVEVPEPVSLLLLGLGGVFIRRRS